MARYRNMSIFDANSKAMKDRFENAERGGSVDKIELHRALSRVLTAKIPKDCASDLELLRDYIENSEPVKHAEWKICSDGYYPYCSNCKNEPQGREMTSFCPNCGARMHGD